MNRLKSAENLLHQVALENFVRCNTLENLQKEWEFLTPIEQILQRDALEAACRRVDRAGGFTYSAEEVCRLVKIATLSDAERAAIEAGATQPILRSPSKTAQSHETGYASPSGVRRRKSKR